jgi:RHS repeat-associated protein
VPLLNKKEGSNLTFTATLSSPTNATLGATTTDTVTIVNTPLTSAAVDVNAYLVLPPNAPVNTPINTFSGWSMSVKAQTDGAIVSSYSWSFNTGSDATFINNSNGYNLTWNWASFNGAARTNTLTLTLVAAIPGSAGSEQITHSFTFLVNAQDSPAYASSRPATFATWMDLFGPDQLNGQDMLPAGPYASVGLVDGSAQAAFSVPDYNPNAAPLSLVYNSAVAYPQPIFLWSYWLGNTPTTFTAQMSVADLSGTTVYTGSTVYYDLSRINNNNTFQIGSLQATGLTSLATGRYNATITVTQDGTTTDTFVQPFNFINGSTTPTSGSTATTSPFGPGWSLANVERLWPVSGSNPGAIIQNPDGTSLWFPLVLGSYTTPAGDFSTLTLSGGVYTRTMHDGTKIKFNSSGQQTAIVDRNGNTTTFTYNTSNQLVSVTDMNSQVTTITYSGTTGLATTITDPASRSLGLAYTSTKLTTITDPNSNAWAYGYDSSDRLTSIKDPRSTGSNYTTTFSYNFASEVTSVSQPDGTTETISPRQLVGLPTPGTGTSTSPARAALAAAAFATYTDPNSQTWTEYFDGLGFGRPVEIVDPLGDTAVTYLDGNGLPWLSADPLGRRERLFFDSSGNVTKDVFPDDTYSTAASYNSFGEPQTVTDAAGAVTSYSYDTHGNVLTIQDGPTALVTNTTTFTYYTNGLVKTVTDARNYTSTYAYDTLNRLSTVTDALLHTQTWTYDTYGNVATYTDPNGHTTSYTYNALNEMTGEVRPQSATVSSTYTYTYDTVGNLTTKVTPLSTGVSATDTSTYDSMNRLTQETDPLGNVTTYLYDNAGNLVGITNALGYTTSYTVDNAGRVITVTVPLTSTTSATTSYTLDAAGEVTAVTDPLSHTTDMTYTLNGWLASVTDPLGNSTSYAYNAVGDQTSVTQTDTSSNSQTSSATYYFHHLLHTTTDALSSSDVTTYGYDGDYNLVTIQDFDGNTTTLAYDALDRQQSSNFDGAVTTYGYDNNGNVSTITDPLSNVTTYTFDYQDRTLSEASPNGKTMNYSYDLAGRLLSVGDPTTYAYDADGRLTATTNPNGYTATYSYNAIGELTAMTDFNGHETTYSYNRAGWLTGENWTAGSHSVVYSYDNAGHLTGAGDNSSTYTFTYNNDGSLHTSAVSYAGSGIGTVTLTYGYDGFGNRTSLADSAGAGATITYAYNHNHQLTSLVYAGATTATMTFDYGTSGSSRDLLTTMTMKGGGTNTLTAAYAYDSHSRLTTITYADAASHTLPTFGYTYNNGNQVTQYTGPEGTLTYLYDTVGELTTVRGAESYTYSFDTSGNRNGTGYTTTTGNEMTADAAGRTMAYDHSGNLTSMTDAAGHKWTYTWDYRNRLTQVVEKDSSGTTTLLNEQFTYDVFNNLIGVSVNGTQQRWTVYDGQNAYIDFDGSGTLTQRYLSGGEGQYFGHVAGSTVDWYLTDLTGSTREIRDGSGTQVATASYDSFGNVVSQMGTMDRFKFQGGEWDSNIGLYHFGARWNDPVDGRWISQDPLGFAAGDSNLYRFVGNQPTDERDPSGLGPLDDASQVVRTRVAQLEAALLPRSGHRVTMAVAIVENANGVRSVLVGTSEPRGYLRPGVTLQPGETMVTGSGHAEADIVTYARLNNLRIIDIGATNRVCPACQDAIRPTGANISTRVAPRPRASGRVTTIAFAGLTVFLTLRDAIEAAAIDAAGGTYVEGNEQIGILPRRMDQFL